MYIQSFPPKRARDLRVCEKRDRSSRRRRAPPCKYASAHNRLYARRQPLGVPQQRRRRVDRARRQDAVRFLLRMRRRRVACRDKLFSFERWTRDLDRRRRCADQRSQRPRQLRSGHSRQRTASPNRDSAGLRELRRNRPSKSTEALSYISATAVASPTAALFPLRFTPIPG